MGVRFTRDAYKKYRFLGYTPWESGQDLRVCIFNRHPGILIQVVQESHTETTRLVIFFIFSLNKPITPAVEGMQIKGQDYILWAASKIRSMQTAKYI